MFKASPMWYDPAREKFEIAQMPEQVREIIKEAGISDEDLNRRGSSQRYFEILQSNGVGNAEDESCVPSYLLKAEDEASFKYSDS